MGFLQDLVRRFPTVQSILRSCVPVLRTIFDIPALKTGMANDYDMQIEADLET